jgi:ankyrin repeat protein
MLRLLNNPVILRAISFTSTLLLSLGIVGALPGARARRQRSFAEASMTGNVARMQVLHLTGANVNARTSCCTPLFLAAGSGNAEAVRFLIRQGADVNARERFGQTALSEAAFYGNVAVIKELLKNGADVNAVGNDGTALDVAAKTNNGVVADLLKHYGGRRACELSRQC